MPVTRFWTVRARCPNCKEWLAPIIELKESLLTIADRELARITPAMWSGDAHCHCVPCQLTHKTYNLEFELIAEDCNVDSDG